MDAFYLIPNAAEFRIYTTPEILQLSVKEIKSSQTFDLLENPIEGGLHDNALGSISRDDTCGSCGQSDSKCPGHFGHIKIPVLLYNPILLKQLLVLLHGTCLFCQKLKIPTHISKACVMMLMLLRKGLFVEAQFVTEKFLKGDTSTSELDDEMDEFEKKYENECDQKVTTKHSLTLFKLAMSLIYRILKSSSLKCCFCNSMNRGLKFQNNTTIIGTLINPIKSGSQKKSAPEETVSMEEDIKTEMEDQVTTTIEDEVEMDQLDPENVESTMDKDGEEEEGIMEMNPEIDRFTSSPYKQAVLSPFVAQAHLKQVWAKDKKFLKAVFPFLAQVSGLQAATDVFFLDVIPVSPSRFRPINFTKGHKYEHQQTTKLSNVISECERMVDLLADYASTVFKAQAIDVETSTVQGLKEGLESGSGNPDVQESMTAVTAAIYQGWLRLQVIVNSIYDNSMDKNNKDVYGGVRQTLEKKEGLFRSNMMGKRVNHAARSVISPDPYIAVNQIGVPEIFASKLTYPQPVTPWNVHVLRQLVINGPHKYPGAVSVTNEDGTSIRLSGKDQTQREAIANQLLVTDKSVSNRKTVCRHLLNGDYVLMNRQPTLHRPSIQAHKARILGGIKTFRMHYSNCKAYNADFDGDEMNMHFPQDELGRAEAATLVCTDFQYLVPKDGTPLGGLIQDHMVAGVTLTTRGRFFNKHDYCSLLWGAMSDIHEKLDLLPPSIVKPQALWSGKQIISTIVLNIIPKDQAPLNLNGKTKIPEKSWITPNIVNEAQLTPINLKAWYSDELGESTVVFRQGELLQGVLDKAHYGPSPYGLVHSCYELYGGVIAGKLLTYLGRLFATFLQMIGFSLGVGDILVLKKANKKRKSIIKRVRSAGKLAVSKALSRGKETEMSKSEMLDGLAQAHFDKDNLKMAEIDMYMKRETDQIQDGISKSIMPVGLEKKFPENSLQLMVQSGAKGSPVNCMQISCLLGQIELEGRRPPLMMSGRSLPCFRPYDTSPQAGGFVTGRFLTGIRPTEYFFHCMAGREGLIDTAVKTSRSGYLQRCLVKHLEGIMVNYDLTVRDGDGGVIQFYYGEDGIDAVKCSYLNPSQFPFLSENLEAIQCTAQSPWLSPNYSNTIRKTWKRIKRWEVKTDVEGPKVDRENGFHSFCNSQRSESDDEEKRKLVTTGKYMGRSESSQKLCEAWLSLDEDQRMKLLTKKTCPDPVMSKHLPHSQPNVLSEKFKKVIDLYCKNDLDKDKIDQDEFKTAINKKIIQSMAHPGEAVGLLCAQSVGEPSTQMTLNTFHFAGRGEMNVTLGIPRLREILMTGTEMPKTPQVDVPIRDIPDALKQAEKLRAKLTTVTFNQVLESVQVKVNSVSQQHDNFKMVKVKFKCLRQSQYRDICSLKYKHIVEFVVNRFIAITESAIRRENRILKASSLLTTGKLRRSAYVREVKNEEQLPPADNEEEEKEDKFDEPNDGDAATVKEQQRQLDTNEYEGEDEERQEVNADDEDAESGEEEKQEEDRSDEEDKNESHKEDKLAEKISSKDYDKFCKQAMVYTSVKAMTFHNDDKRAFTVTFQYPPECLQFDIRLMFERIIKSSIIQQVQGIKQAFISKEMDNGKSELHLKTDGINVEYLFGFPDILDLDRLYTNSIYHMWKFYGIEAANRAIIKEIEGVFAAYGIAVNYHHLSLLADYMTHRGQYDSFSRIGIDGTQTSPLQKITFETSMNFLLDACFNNHKDHLKSPSAQLILGKPIGIGTGCFDVLLK